jgi:hypothetical protein
MKDSHKLIGQVHMSHIVVGQNGKNKVAPVLS